ncbi:DUF5710 domain-containing protein [Denitratisoma oestradiolicum]|uniref:Uncharacterized protein n=1 Tax=Denitratisoma oestradiolicum TaxID=311182 RepID=A0A6S6YQH4_9PROT|nr:DUF5710 domain-containing protein [Denitratisoma oestradiolicum]TWO80131.1 hypothetical protein CBW56_11205 [Denitratisoma oestradiolicum]CAB1370032.1 conserved protein of unknown function [Denitratisoma oestradiolicum]
MRINLKVPFAEKDEAKKLGARWDGARKIWYVENKDDMAPFARWSPHPHDSTDTRVSQPSRAEKNQAASLVIKGSGYVDLPRVCDCLPWEDCGKCKGTVPAC